jgi:hypothetical protein
MSVGIRTVRQGIATGIEPRAAVKTTMGSVEVAFHARHVRPLGQHPVRLLGARR